MLILCINYCIPLLWFLFFISGPFFIIFGMFAIKRGTRIQNKQMRKTAFVLMFAAVLKMFTLDVHMLDEQVKNRLCAIGGHFPRLDCTIKAISPHESIFLSFLGIVLLCVCCAVLFQAYVKYMPDRKPVELSPEDVNLRLWVNSTLWAVILLAVWTVAPWVGALTDSKLPAAFKNIHVVTIALIDLGLILFDFWKVESVVWERKMGEKVSEAQAAKRAHLTRTWTSRDTLWMVVFLYFLTLGLGYVGNDVLGDHKEDANKPVEHHWSIKDIIPDVDISNPALKNQ